MPKITTNHAITYTNFKAPFSEVSMDIRLLLFIKKKKKKTWKGLFDLCHRFEPFFYYLINRSGTVCFKTTHFPHWSHPSSKYKHLRTSAMLRYIRNIRICMGKKHIVSVTYENKRMSIKKKLTVQKMCVTSLLCGPSADLRPFYGLYCERFPLYFRFT